MDINTVALTGRLGSTPELRHTTQGKPVLEISLAVNFGYGDNQRTNWIGLVFWDTRAETLAKHCQSGDKIAIQGRLDQSTWEDSQTGQKKSKTKVVVNEWTFAQSPRIPSGKDNWGSLND